MRLLAFEAVKLVESAATETVRNVGKSLVVAVVLRNSDFVSRFLDKQQQKQQKAKATKEEEEEEKEALLR